jgi:hypothetical protein
MKLSKIMAKRKTEMKMGTTGYERCKMRRNREGAGGSQI